MEHVREYERKEGERSKEENKNISSALLRNTVVHTYIRINVEHELLKWFTPNIWKHTGRYFVVTWNYEGHSNRRLGRVNTT